MLLFSTFFILYPCCVCASLFSAASTNNKLVMPPTIYKQPSLHTIFFEVEDKKEPSRPVVLECEAFGYPEPFYIWTKNGNRIIWTDFIDNIQQQPGVGTLVFYKLQKEDAGQYQCYASNIYGTSTSNSITLKANQIIRTTQLTENVTAKEGRPFMMECNIPINGWPNGSINWILKDDIGKFNPIDDPRITVDPEGRIWFSNVIKLDESIKYFYACTVYRPKGIQIIRKINLTVSPLSTNEATSSIMTLQYKSNYTVKTVKGESVKLYCIIGGTPLPEIFWGKYGENLHTSERVRFLNHKKTLEISNVSLNDNGIYKCDASNNGYVHGLSYAFELKVEYPPIFVVKPKFITTIEGANEEFDCVADGIPYPVIKWIHNGRPIEDSVYNSRRTLLGNKILFQNVKIEDTGNYGCNASNYLGYIYKDVFLNVEAQKKLDTSDESVNGKTSVQVISKEKVEKVNNQQRDFGPHKDPTQELKNDANGDDGNRLSIVAYNQSENNDVATEDKTNDGLYFLQETTLALDDGLTSTTVTINPNETPTTSVAVNIIENETSTGSVWFFVFIGIIALVALLALFASIMALQRNYAGRYHTLEDGIQNAFYRANLMDNVDAN